MKTLRSCVLVLALIPVLPVIALAWLCAWMTPQVRKPVIVSPAPIPKSLMDTVRIGARQISAVAALLMMGQTVDVIAAQARAAEPSCHPTAATKPNHTVPAATFASDTISRQAATCCHPKAACCVPATLVSIPVIEADSMIEAIPQFQPAILQMLIADDPWMLINSQINALQIMPPKVSVDRKALGQSFALRRDSRKTFDFDRDTTG